MKDAPDGRAGRIATVLLALVFALTACQWSGASSATSPAPQTASAAPSSAASSAAPPAPSSTAQFGPTVPSATGSPNDPVDLVLAISIDGLNPAAIVELGAKGTPTLHKMMREGAWTFNARTEQESTLTLPNHTGMLTGRRVAAQQGGHGVTFNNDNGTSVHAAAGEYVASAFDVVHDRGGSTALYSAKTKFAFFARTWNADGAPDQVGADNGRDKIDRVVLDTDNAQLVRTLNAELKRSPSTFTFLHVSLPDVAGHAHGFMGPEYPNAVQQTDRLMGTVLATISGQPRLRDHLLVILTADHGGIGRDHFDPTKLADYRIPFMAWGPGVAAGRDLYALNPTFAGPGRSRPGYSGRQPIRNGDVANLATGVLDLPTVPDSELDRLRTLNVFG